MDKKDKLTRKQINLIDFILKNNGYIYRNMKNRTDHYIMDNYPYTKYIDRDTVNCLVKKGLLEPNILCLTIKALSCIENHRNDKKL